MKHEIPPTGALPRPSEELPAEALALAVLERAETDKEVAAQAAAAAQARRTKMWPRLLR